jgi:hypothetical protein
VHLRFKFIIYESTEFGLNCKDDRGYVTISCVSLLIFCDEMKILRQFLTRNISSYELLHRDRLEYIT